MRRRSQRRFQRWSCRRQRAAVAPAVAPAPAVERQDAGETPDVVADLDDDEDEELPAGFVQSVQGNYLCAFQVRLSAEPARAPGS